jgi:3-methyladenine DNA glycosylase AlkD
LRAVAKHNHRLAEAVVNSGAIDALVECLQQFDYGVKEAAAWALGNIAKHNGELAQSVVDHESVPLLLLCVKEPELSLKKVAASALGYICGHSPELAQAVVDAEGIQDISPLIENPKVKRQACTCLANIAKHSVALAEIVVDGEIFPKIFTLLGDPDDPAVRKNAANCIREIAKHTPELSAHIVNSGGLPYLVAYVKNGEGDAKLPGIMTLGFISAFSETMATSVIEANAIAPLGKALAAGNSDHVKSAAAWALGQIGRHSSMHAQRVAEANIFKALLDTYFAPTSSDDLKQKCKRSLKSVIQKCTYLDALNPLLQENAPENILKHVVKQYSKVLARDVEAKKKFVTTKGLARLQKIRTEDEEFQETIKLINTFYPEEVVRYYSPNYDRELLDKIEEETDQ